MRRTVLVTIALASMLAAACSSEADPTSTPTPTTEATSTVEAASTVVSPQITGTPDEMPPLSYTYETVEGDTLGSVATRFGVSEAAVRLSNPDIEGEPAPGTALRVPAIEGVLHTMELGETLTNIAARYGVEVEAIIDFASNGLSSPEDGTPGAIILVPGGTGG
ncbi:MAG: LysM peptidoglycan-binding domain-containing protein [Dehalococcoidia bacterium]